MWKLALIIFRELRVCLVIILSIYIYIYIYGLQSERTHTFSDSQSSFACRKQKMYFNFIELLISYVSITKYLLTAIEEVSHRRVPEDSHCHFHRSQRSQINFRRNPRQSNIC